MTQNLAEENLIRGYFLGELPEFEEDRVQERLVTEEDFFETSLMIAGELVDDYAFGLLLPEDQRKLENRLLVDPQEYQRVQFTRMLRELVLKSGFGSTSKTTEDPIHSPFHSESKFSSAVKALPDTNSAVRLDDTWTSLLSEAQSNRRLLFSLISNDWLGLRLLGRIHETLRASRSELANEFTDSNNILSATLVLLAESGLIEEHDDGMYCSTIGADILERIEAMSDSQTS